MVYNFITPSDPITFLAPNDKIAYACAIIIGGGKADCDNIDTGEKLHTMIFIHEDPIDIVEDFLESPFNNFVKANEIEISKALSSFAYGLPKDRAEYDNQLSGLNTPEEIEKFKEEHEDKERSSLQRWVKKAWIYSEKIPS